MNTKHQWFVIGMLIGCVVCFAGCDQIVKIFTPVMTDEAPTEMDAPEEMPDNEGIGIFDTDVMAGHGLVTEVYIPGGKLTRLPDFDTLTSVRTFTVANIDVSHREYTQGFPELGINVLEDFAIRLRGKLKIETAGPYNFTLSSDDGSKLFINGTLIINNDGLHSMLARSGSVTLTAGLHDVEVQYFQGPRTHIGLQWFWDPPHGTAEIVPPEVLYPPE